MTQAAMRRFWDDRAAEDAFFFVDSRSQYGDPDLERFWTEGEEDLDTFLEYAGASIEASDRVVEIGCGVGRVTRPLSRRAASVRALDVSERMLELAREHNPGLENVEWILGDGTSLAGVESESADACVSLVVFQHIPDAAITLGYVREVGRVLRPGGWAALHVSNDPDVHRGGSRRTRARTAVRALLRSGPHGRGRAYWRGSHVTIDALRETAAEASMRVEHVVGEGSLWCVVRLRRV
jgi:SAM-dependent methyltransferase